jgi:hypothetical protein
MSTSESTALAAQHSLAEYKQLINGALAKAVPYQKEAGRYVMAMIGEHFTTASGYIDTDATKRWIAKNVVTLQTEGAPTWSTLKNWVRFAGGEFKQRGEQLLLLQVDREDPTRGAPQTIEEFRQSVEPGRRANRENRPLGTAREVSAEWARSVKPAVDAIDVDRLAKVRQDAEQEERLVRSMGMKLIDLGYQILAKKLHPDKGGSSAAMVRLNEVRRRLKAAL